MKFINKIKAFFLNTYKDFLKGIVLGAVTVVPGVSGGTMAIILGMYSKLIFSINTLFKFKKDTIIFLVVTGLGAVGGVLLLSSVIGRAIDAYPALTNWFFAGIVLGSFPLMIKESQISAFELKNKKKTPLLVFLFLAGASVVISLSFVQDKLVDLSAAKGITALAVNFAAGFLTAAALVLPGISGSLFLTAIGLYTVLISSISISSPNLVFLVPFALGVIAGVFMTSKFIEKVFDKYRSFTFIAICGFLAGTFITMLQSPALLFSELLFAILLLIAGAAITVSLFFISLKFTVRAELPGSAQLLSDGEIPADNNSAPDTDAK